MFSVSFSPETLEEGSQWNNVVKVLKGESKTKTKTKINKNLSLRILYPPKLSFKIERYINVISDIQKRCKFITAKPTL